jgi:hypothetical protein
MALVSTLHGGNRRSFIGGSDARIIMGSDEAALIRLWREKRGEFAPQDLSGNLTGGGKWVEMSIPKDPLYLTVLVSAEKKFWRCVQSGETPHLVNAEPPRPRIEVLRIVDMSASNSWAEFAALFRNTRTAFLDHERAKNELKALMPEDAKEAIGYGVRGRRTKAGAVWFDLLEREASHAAVQ